MSDMDLEMGLLYAVRAKASDIHLTAGVRPFFRIHGELVPWLDDRDGNRMTGSMIQEIAESLMTAQQFEAFLRQGGMDFSFVSPSAGRFRVSAYRQRGSTSLVFRPVPDDIPELEALGFSSTVPDLLNPDKLRGLILVTGAASSGKSTTLASIVHRINQTRAYHVITLEDPIEYLHTHAKSIVEQREIGHDAESMPVALRACLRQDPDVIALGSLDDLETASLALIAAEMGYCVLAAMYSNSAVQAVESMIEMFPGSQKDRIRLQLALSLRAVITQQLLPGADGQGRIMAHEILVGSPAVRNLIRDNKLHQIQTVLETSPRWGMQSMDMSLAFLVRSQKISSDTALWHALDKDHLQRLLG
ncbi:MAG: PilT/PilU family type 4a pilus ATPase [Peptococcaceae bacterium]|jgi:twitching motility protein PilT|nr:PilT/PilU family type 4a pilus ATPase [Peptococcaceae bacterium]